MCIKCAYEWIPFCVHVIFPWVCSLFHIVLSENYFSMDFALQELKNEIIIK